MVAKLANLERDMGKAAHIAEKNAAKMQQAFATVGRTLATLGATLSVGAFGAMVKSLADAGDQLQKLSTKTGATVEELSKLQYAGSLADVSNEELAKSLTRLNMVMGDAANGSKEATDALARFGIDPSMGLTVSEAFKQIADRVKATGDETKIASGLNDIFGRSFAQLIPLLKGGSSELKVAGDELERMGGVMSGDLAKSSEAFNDNMTRLYTQLNAIKLDVIGPLIPLFLEVSGAMAQTSEKSDQLSSSGQALKTIFEAVAVLGANTAYVFRAMGTEIGGIGAQIAALAKGDFKAFSNIGAMMREDAEKARKEIDALTDRLLNPGKIANAPTSSTSTGPGIIGSPVANGKKTAAKQQKEYVDALTSTAEAYAKAVKSIDDAQLAAFKSTLTLNSAQSALLDLMESPYWDEMPQTWRDILQAQTELATSGIEAARSQQRLNELMAATPSAELEKARSDMQLLAEAFKLGQISAEEFNEAASARLGLTGEINEQTKAVEKQKTAAEELGMSFSSAFEDAVVGGKKFSDVLDGLYQDILRIMVRKNITEPLAESIKGFDFAGMFSANALGNVYSSPSLSAYSGQVVNRPTPFMFASGAGIMGEAGPEAIMPLKRGKDGKLGIAGGGEVTVNVINNANGTQATQQTRQDAGGKTIIDVMIETVKGAIASDIGSGGMVAGAMESQYGLNRAAGAWR